MPTVNNLLSWSSILKLPSDYKLRVGDIGLYLTLPLRKDLKMENLNVSEVDEVGGAYLRLVDVEAFVKLETNQFKGGILHTNPSAPMRKEKAFPALPNLLD